MNWAVRNGNLLENARPDNSPILEYIKEFKRLRFDFTHAQIFIWNLSFAFDMIHRVLYMYKLEDTFSYGVAHVICVRAV